MDDAFTKRVAAAAAAGWVAVIILAVFMTIGWVLAALMMSHRPGWAPVLCGGNVTWDALQPLYLWAFTVMKVMLWAFLTIVIWLTLWGRRLRRAA